MSPTTSARIGALAAVRLLAALRLRRGLNQVQASFSMWRRGKDADREHNDKHAGTPRTGTAGKAKLGWLLAGLIGFSMLFGAFNISSQAVLNMQQAFGVTFSSTDRVEGTKAFVEKRDPKWQGK